MTATMSPVRVRVHITDGQRLALITVLDNTPEPRVRVSSHTVLFDLDDPRGWLEARMAEWPRSAFPRASLHGVLRKLSAAIQGQVQPDLRPSILRRAADHIRTGRLVDLRAGNALVVAVSDLVPAKAQRGVAMSAIRAVNAHLGLDTTESPLTEFAWWERHTSRADIIDALESTATALDDEEAGS